MLRAEVSSKRSSPIGRLWHMRSALLRSSTRRASRHHLRHLATSSAPPDGTRHLHQLGPPESRRIFETSESFFTPAHRVTVEVPATTSNLGPGFDCMGLALDVRNRLTVEKSDRFSLEVSGEGASGDGDHNLSVMMCHKVFKRLGKPTPPLRFHFMNAVPLDRGFGSNSTALLSGLAAGLALCGRELYTPATKRLLLELAAEEELARADNLAPAIYGGFQIALRHDGAWVAQRVATPTGLQCVLFIPDDVHMMARPKTRAVLPTELSYGEVVHNLSRAAMLVNSFQTGQFDALRFAMEDKLHQPHREHLCPTQPIIRAALAAGAHGAFVSGAGPSVVCICGGTTGKKAKDGKGRDNYETDTMALFLGEAVSEAVLRAAAQHGITGHVHMATPSAVGLTSSGHSAAGELLWDE